jgi:trans-aconitate methyltransferase
VTDPQPVRYAPQWLGVREAADGLARSRELANLLTEDLTFEQSRRRAADRSADRAAERAADRSADRPAERAADRSAERPPIVVHDLGCGTGSMARWQAPRLPGPQHWVLHDRDPDLLRLAASAMPQAAADGRPITAETRAGDLTRLAPADLAGADLVTGSALLDLLTRDEVDRLADLCAQVQCSALFTLSVTGWVEFTPTDPLDDVVRDAFNAHQRRVLAGRRLLGPDAVDAAREAFGRAGAELTVRPSPWLLGAGDAALIAQWLHGWVGAAQEQSPRPEVDNYLRRRLAQASQGRLLVAVHHADLLASFERILSRPETYESLTVRVPDGLSP